MVSVQQLNEIARHRALRRAVFARDHGVCGRCGRDCEALRTRLRSLSPEARRLERARLGIAAGKRALWEAHHVQERALGGGDELANLSTRCWRCHAQATAAFLAERARRQRESVEARGELAGIFG